MPSSFVSLRINLCLCVAAPIVLTRSMFGSTPPADLDPSFNARDITGGIVRAIALQPDGKVLVGGDFILLEGNASTNLSVARLNEDGSLDSTFRSLSHSYGIARSIVIQPDGRVLVATDYSLLRLKPDGQPDDTFLSHGIFLTYFSVPDFSVS